MMCGIITCGKFADIEVMKREEWIQLGAQLKVDRESMVKLIETQKVLEDDWGWFASDIEIEDMDYLLEYTKHFKFEGQMAVRVMDRWHNEYREHRE